MSSRAPALLLLVATCVLGLGNLACDSDNPTLTVRGLRTFTVRIENLTSSQPFSPGFVATHSTRDAAWATGTNASEGLRLIAENGDPTTAVTELDANPAVGAVVDTAAPVHRIGGPGDSVIELTITAAPDDEYLSLAVMLICTNDGFVGVNSTPLPTGTDPSTVMLNTYDAGTEANDERFVNIVDPCGAIGPEAVAGDGSNGRTATAVAIARHGGVTGGGDLSPTHDWTDPVARLTITPVP
ncbi:MAG: spondin domain-containing protein [Acidobacteriota bacterium]